MRNSNKTAFKSLSLFALATLFCCFTIGAPSVTSAQNRSKITLNKSSNPISYSVPRKQIGVGFPSPYSYSSRSVSRGSSLSRNSSFSRGNSFSRGPGASVDFRRNSSIGRNSYNYNRNSGRIGSSYNRGRSGIAISLAPYNSYRVSGFGTSTLYRPTYGSSSLIYGNRLGFGGVGIGSSFYSTRGYGYGNQPYPDQYNPGYVQPQTVLRLSPEEEAARADLYGNGSPAPTTISNQYYARIPTSAAARSFQTRAEQAFKSGDYGQATDMAEKAVTVDSTNGKLRLFASQSNFALGNYNQAIDHLDSATRSLSKSQWSYVVKNFKQFYGQNDYVAQTDRLSQKIAVQPGADLYALRGYHYGSLGYFDAASADFQTALQFDPNHALASRLKSALENSEPESPENIQAPIPAGVSGDFQNSTIDDGIIRLVPQRTSLEDVVPEPVPDTSNLPTYEIPLGTGESILLESPSDDQN